MNSPLPFLREGRFIANQWPGTTCDRALRMPMATKFRQQYNIFPGDLSKNRRASSTLLSCMLFSKIVCLEFAIPAIYIYIYNYIYIYVERDLSCSMPAQAYTAFVASIVKASVEDWRSFISHFGSAPHVRRHLLSLTHRQDLYTGNWNYPMKHGCCVGRLLSVGPDDFSGSFRVYVELPRCEYFVNVWVFDLLFEVEGLPQRR